jgi:hypothetical protein
MSGCKEEGNIYWHMEIRYVYNQVAEIEIC